MTAYADSRPPGLNVPFRPGNTLSIELTWPTGQLTGRTFTSTLDGVVLGLAVVGDVMTIEATEAQTSTFTDPAVWLLTETTGGATNDLVIGTWTPSERSGVASSLSLPVTVGEVTVNVSVISGQASILALQQNKVSRSGDTMTGTLLVPNITLNGVALGGVTGTPNVMTVAGAITTFHDFLFVRATDMATNGTAPVVGASVPRCVLAKGNAVTLSREVPAAWGQISLNILFTKEVTGSGNAHFSLNYDVVNFLGGASMIGTGTTIDVGGVSVPTNVGDSKYFIINSAQTIPTPPQAFGLPPLVRVTLTRVNDGTDTYAGSVGLAAVSISRTSS